MADVISNCWGVLCWGICQQLFLGVVGGYTGSQTGTGYPQRNIHCCRHSTSECHERGDVVGRSYTGGNWVSFFRLAQLIISTGGLNVVCPIFQSEIATKDERGKNVGAHGFMFVFGLSCVNWVALGCFFITNEEMAWRLVFGLQGVPPALLLLIGIWLPESPRWLVMKGRTNEAYDIMTKLHETSRTLDSHDIFHAEIATIEQQIEIESHYDLSWIGLFKRPSTRRRLLLGMFMMFFQQSTGQNVLYGFQVNILSQLGLTDWQPLLVVAFYTLWAAVLNIAGAAVVDKVGRRPMFLIGLVSSCVNPADPRLALYCRSQYMYPSLSSTVTRPTL
jgi:MFS family permease